MEWPLPRQPARGAKRAGGHPGLDRYAGNAVSGSADRYQGNGRSPWNSVNFMVAHDGFTTATFSKEKGATAKQRP